MKITYKSDYALKTVLDLAMHYGNSPVNIQDLAGRADIPPKFLEQILLDLKRGGFVESRRGKVGGYLLAKSPAEITVGDIIRFMEGPLEPIACLEKHYAGCKDLYKCVFRPIWQDIGEYTARILDKFTFEDLVKQSQAKKEAILYQI